jgi:hypothetical protein
MCDERDIAKPPWKYFGSEDSSVGQLDLGSIAYCADYSDPRDRCDVHGLRGAQYPGSAGRPKPSLTAYVCDHDWRYTAMGLLLAVLHGIEAGLWAAAYLWLGALGSPETAILYSVDTMATRGASEIMLQPHWQMMGALEAADGMLLFGISTAFIFTVMQFYYLHLMFRTPPGGSARVEEVSSAQPLDRVDDRRRPVGRG